MGKSERRKQKGRGNIQSVGESCGGEAREGGRKEERAGEKERRNKKRKGGKEQLVGE